MKIEQSQVTKLLLTELDRLDPVTVLLEDYGDNRGKLIIECYGKSWSKYWGSMGGTLADFIQFVSADYIANCLDREGDHTELDFETFKEKAKKQVLYDRRRRHSDSDEARDAWDEIERYFPENIHEVHACRAGYIGSVLVSIFGDDWWHAIPTKINPDYAYLLRIVDAVKEGLAMYAKGNEQ